MLLNLIVNWYYIIKLCLILFKALYCIWVFLATSDCLATLIWCACYTYMSGQERNQKRQKERIGWWWCDVCGHTKQTVCTTLYYDIVLRTEIFHDTNQCCITLLTKNLPYCQTKIYISQSNQHQIVKICPPFWFLRWTREICEMRGNYQMLFWLITF